VPVFIPLARAGQVAPPSAKPVLTPKEALAARTKAFASKSGAKPVAKTEGVPASSFDAALVDAGADDAVAALAKAGEAGAALVDAWAAAGNAAAVVEVAESEAAPSAARKAARRALNVLRARGVAIPTRDKAIKREEAVVPEAEAVFTAPDVQGTFILSLTRRDPSGRFQLGEVMIREPFGVIQAWGGWVSGSQIKESRSRQTEGYGIAPVPVPVAWARHRIAEARKLNASSGQVAPLGLERCLPLLDPTPDAAPDHPVKDLEAEITSERAASAAPGSGKLHEEPEFRGWLADRRAVEELLVKLGERIGPQGKDMDRGLFDAALAEEIAAATDRYFSPEVRGLLVSRIRDAAISIRSRKGDRAASDVLAVARAISEAGLITSPPRDIPFLKQFFEIGLRAIAQQTGGELRVPIPQGQAQPAG
jgi:hypothetical protein